MSFRSIGLLFFCAFSALNALYAAPSFSVSAEARPTNAHIGDIVRLSVHIRYATNVRVALPEVEETLGAFSVRDVRISEPERVEGVVEQTILYSLAVYETGRFMIPPIEVSALNAQGERKRTTPAIQIDIAPLVENASEARDIPEGFPEVAVRVTTRRELAAVIGSFLALCAVFILSYVIYRYIIRAHRFDAPVYVHEYVEAHNALSEALRKGRLASGRYEELYADISEILKRYIGRRFAMTALEETTESLSRKMEEKDIPEREAIEAFLMRADMAKYARANVPRKEAEKDVQFVRSFLERTRRTEGGEKKQRARG